MPSDMTPSPTSDSARLYSAVDRSNETYEPSPHAPRRTVPSGRVSPDGKRAWPQPSLTSRIVVFGGMGIAAAAATAGAVLAVRTVVDAIAGDDDDDPVEAARQRARARSSGDRHSGQYYRSAAMRSSDADRDDDRRAERQRAERERNERMRREAARRRAASSPTSGRSNGSVVESVNETVASVTSGVRDILATVTAAIEGFRSVAAQAGDVMADFNKAADQVKSMVEPVATRRPDPGSYTRPGKKDVVDLRDDDAVPGQGTGDRDGPQDSRSHRL